jgi:hypothetical protein
MFANGLDLSRLAGADTIQTSAASETETAAESESVADFEVTPESESAVTPEPAADPEETSLADPAVDPEPALDPDPAAAPEAAQARGGRAQRAAPGTGVGFSWNPSSAASVSGNILKVNGDITLTTDDATMPAVNGDHAVAVPCGKTVKISVVTNSGQKFPSGINLAPQSGSLPGIDVGGDATNFTASTILNLDIAAGATVTTIGVGAFGAGIRVEYLNAQKTASLNVSGEGTLNANGGEFNNRGTRGNPAIGAPNTTLKTNDSGNISIVDATVNAKGGVYAPSIGVGTSSNDASGNFAGNFSASGTATIQAYASERAAAIGTAETLEAKGGANFTGDFSLSGQAKLTAITYNGSTAIGTGGIPCQEFSGNVDISEQATLKINALTYNGVIYSNRGGVGIGSSTRAKGLTGTMTVSDAATVTIYAGSGINTKGGGQIIVNGGLLDVYGDGGGSVGYDVNAGIIAGGGTKPTLVVNGGTVIATAGTDNAGTTWGPGINGNVIINGGSLYTSGASGVGQSGGAVDTATVGSPSIKGTVQNNAGKDLYPVYVDAGYATSGTIAVPAAVGFISSDYTAPLGDLRQPDLGGLLPVGYLNELGMPPLPTTDTLAAVLWLPGAAGPSYAEYSGVVASANPTGGIYEVKVEDNNKAFGPENLSGTALQTKLNLVKVEPVVQIGFKWSLDGSAWADRNKYVSQDPNTHIATINGSTDQQNPLELWISTANDQADWLYGTSGNYTKGGQGQASPDHAIAIKTGTYVTLHVLADTSGQYGTTVTGGINCSPAAATAVPGIDVGGAVTTLNANTTLNLNIADTAKVTCVAAQETIPGVRVEYTSSNAYANFNLSGKGTLEVNNNFLKTNSAAAIGGSGYDVANDSTPSTCGNISIKDTTVVAINKTFRGAAIGTGTSRTSNFKGNISIFGSANVTATAFTGVSGTAAGIGTAREDSVTGVTIQNSFTGSVTISDSAIVKATGGGAGIGMGNSNSSTPGYLSGAITISDNATVIAQGTNRSAGIGTGYGNNGSNSITGKITIGTGSGDTCKVYAKGGDGGPGLGSGGGGINNSPSGDVGDIVVNGGTLIAQAGDAVATRYTSNPPAAGIGSGPIIHINNQSLPGKPADLTINGGTVIAIGSGVIPYSASTPNPNPPGAPWAPGVGSSLRSADGAMTTGGSVTVNGGSLYTYGASSVGKTDGSVNTSSKASPSISGMVKNAGGKTAYPVYVQDGYASEGTITVPALSGVTAAAYSALLCDLDSANLGGLLDANFQKALSDAGLAFAAPAADPISAVLWLPGAANPYNTYKNITTNLGAGTRQAVVENAYPAYTTAYNNKRNILDVQPIVHLGFKWSEDSGATKNWFDENGNVDQDTIKRVATITGSSDPNHPFDLWVTTANDQSAWYYGSPGNYTPGGKGQASPDHAIAIKAGTFVTLHVVTDSVGTYGTTASGGLNCSPTTYGGSALDLLNGASTTDVTGLTLDLGQGATLTAAGHTYGAGVRVADLSAYGGGKAALAITGSGTLIARGGLGDDAYGSAGIGTVAANGASVGYGNSYANSADLGSVSISGSVKVSAIGADDDDYYGAAGIGTGFSFNGRSGDLKGDIEIFGAAQVSARGGAFASGIGSGLSDADSSGSWSGSLTIGSDPRDTCQVFASAPRGVGVGSGRAFSGFSSGDVGDVLVNAGLLYARGGDVDDSGSAGIGSGSSDQVSTGRPANLTVRGGVVIAIGGSNDESDPSQATEWAPGIGSSLGGTMNGGGSTVVNGGNLYTSGAARQNDGSVNTTSFASPSIQGSVTNTDSTDLYPVYVPSSYATSGTVTVPTIAGATKSNYAAPLCNLAAADLGGLINSGTQAQLTQTGIALTAPTTDPLAAVLWLPGAVSPYQRYQNITLSDNASVGALTALVENAVPTYAAAQASGSTSQPYQPKRNIVIAPIIDLSQIKPASLSGLTKVYGDNDPSDWISKVQSYAVDILKDQGVSDLGLKDFNITVSRDSGEDVIANGYAIHVAIIYAGSSYTLSGAPAAANFVITPAPLKVVWTSQNQPNTIFSYPYNGQVHQIFADLDSLKNGEDLTLVPGGVFSATSANSYTATVSAVTAGKSANPGKPSNYSFTSDSKNWTITQEEIDFAQIQAGSLNTLIKEYGENDPDIQAVVWTYARGVLSSEGVLDSDLDQFMITATRTSGEDKGSYPLTITVDYNGSDYDVKNQPADANFTITAAPLTVAWTSDNQDNTLMTYEYDAKPHKINFELKGLKNDEELTPDTTGTFSEKVAGSYIAEVTGIKDGSGAKGGKASNYSLAPSKQGWSIGQNGIDLGQIYLSNLSLTKVYGVADPDLSLAVTPYVQRVLTSEGVHADDLGDFTISAQRVPGEDAGPYALTVGVTYNGSNYSIGTSTPDPGIFTITPAPLTVVWTSDDPSGSMTFPYDGQVHAVYAALDGLKNGEDLTLNRTGTFKTKVAGSHTATVAGVTLGTGAKPGDPSNYSFTSDSKNWTITQEEIDLAQIQAGSLNMLAKEYGENDPDIQAAVWTYARGVLSSEGVLNSDLDQFMISATRTSGEDKGSYPLTITVDYNGSDYNVKNQPADANFAITPAPLTVVWTSDNPLPGDLAYEYDGFSHKINPGLSGLKNGEELVLTTAGDLSASIAGVYTAEVTGIGNGDPAKHGKPGKVSNYSFSPSSQVWKILQNAVDVGRIDLKDLHLAKVYGEDDPDFAQAVASSVRAGLRAEGVHIDDLDLFQISAVRDPGQNVGRYDLRVAIDYAGNDYAVTGASVNADFEITPAPLTVSWVSDGPANGGMTYVYDGQEHQIRAVFSGLRYGDGLTMVRSGDFSGIAAGDYDAHVTDVSDGDATWPGFAMNYDFTPSTQHWTIAKEKVDLALIDLATLKLAKVRGESDPDLSAKVSDYVRGVLVSEGVQTFDLDDFQITAKRAAGEKVGSYRLTIAILYSGSDYDLIGEPGAGTFSITPSAAKDKPDKPGKSDKQDKKDKQDKQDEPGSGSDVKKQDEGAQDKGQGNGQDNSQPRLGLDPDVDATGEDGTGQPPVPGPSTGTATDSGNQQKPTMSAGGGSQGLDPLAALGALLGGVALLFFLILMGLCFWYRPPFRIRLPKRRLSFVVEPDDYEKTKQNILETGVSVYDWRHRQIANSRLAVIRISKHAKGYVVRLGVYKNDAPRVYRRARKTLYQS